ncbi:MAG TPA: tetratricopeptide repeat protein, partial [Fimbriimonadaceae bacterium]|nr:tetratricopeptide repeat protein [Fimbriimonadaceae bacterium]
MVKCSQCGKQNTLDSRFCRACGTEVPADVAAEAREANEKLVAEGRRLLLESRSAEAKLLAETTHENDPASANALSLLGECHERFGHHEQAIECYERVLELQPDSALERIKLDHLRKSMTGQADASPGPSGRNRAAIGAGLAAVALVASIGAVFALDGDKARAETKSSGSTNAVQAPMPTVEAMPKSYDAAAEVATPTKPTADESDDEPAVTEEKPARREPERAAPPRQEPRATQPDRAPT